MTKRKLQLQAVLQLKNDLEERIEQTEKSIIGYNTTDIKIDSLLEKLDKYQEQLIIVKEVIQNANKTKHSTRKTNNYYIYKLSNLQRRKKFYRLLYSSINNTEKSAQLNREEILSRRRSLETEIETLQTKLSNFNINKTVSIEIDESLDLDISI
jgi:chromosome segregation ATPase